MKYFFRKIVLCLTLAVSLTACGLAGADNSAKPASHESKADSSELQILNIGTADSGGTMYPVGKALAEILESSDEQLKINVCASSGSPRNVEGLMSGEFDIGLVSTDIASDALNGSGEFEGRQFEDIRAIGAVYSSLSNWITPKSLGLTYVHDLTGRTISLGPQTSTTALSALYVLSSMDITVNNSHLEYSGLGQAAQQIRDHKLDAAHGFTGAPISSFQELATETPCTILQYTDEELISIILKNSNYYADTIPAGTYEGQEEDIKTFGLKCLICVRADMSDEMAYKLTSILYQQREALAEAHPAMEIMKNRGFMDTVAIPMHDGALKFYQEQR